MKMIFFRMILNSFHWMVTIWSYQTDYVSKHNKSERMLICHLVLNIMIGNTR